MEDFLFDNPIIATILITVLFFTIAFELVYFIDKKSCYSKTELMEIESHYDFWTGCMVKNNGKYEPFNVYNTVNIK